MHVIKNGYVAGAVLLIPFAQKLREHVEYEKFLCRIMVDNEQTQAFKKSTSELKDQLYAFRYNNPASERLTAVGRSSNGS
jgi:hypothetical protein